MNAAWAPTTTPMSRLRVDVKLGGSGQRDRKHDQRRRGIGYELGQACCDEKEPGEQHARIGADEGNQLIADQVRRAGLGHGVASGTMPPISKQVFQSIPRYAWVSLTIPSRPAQLGERNLTLLNQLGAQARELLISDRSRFLEPIELLDLVGNAVANHLAEFLARLLRLLAASLRHAPRLSDHVREDGKVGEHDQRYYPDCLAPTGNVMTPEQVAYDNDEQPEP